MTRLTEATGAISDLAFGEVCVVPESGCGRCGAPLSWRQTRWCSERCRTWWYLNHRWTQAREEAMQRAKRKCVRCGRPAEEVDHIIERNGVPLHSHSCLHHQANLRPLCHECHLTRYEWESLDVPR